MQINQLYCVGGDDPLTPIETVLEWFMRPMAIYGGIDVFMYVTAKPEMKHRKWNGDPDTYEPVANDTLVCTPYTKHPIFQNYTGNRFFCLVEDEIELSTPFTHAFNIWKNYTYGSLPSLREQVLQQLYGMYRANLAAKEYAKANFIDYTYKARLRPDSAFVKKFPVALLNMKGECAHMIWCPSRVIYGNGWEDSFNFGYADAMDKALDRYEDLLTARFDVPLVRQGTHWDLEDFLTMLLKNRYKTCVSSYYDLWIVVIRKNQWGLNTWIPPSNTNQWRQMN
jgi:hypothetical protein